MKYKDTAAEVVVLMQRVLEMELADASTDEGATG